MKNVGKHDPPYIDINRTSDETLKKPRGFYGAVNLKRIL